MILKTLIVEDEYYTRKALVKTIKGLNLPIRIIADVENGDRAVAILEKDSIDLVITDIKMSGIDGLELADWITSNLSGVKIVIISGYSDFEYAQKAINSNVQGYLLKPIREQDLIEVVANILKKIKSDEKKLTEISTRLSWNQVLKFVCVEDILKNSVLFNRIFSETDYPEILNRYCLVLIQSIEPIAYSKGMEIEREIAATVNSTSVFVKYLEKYDEILIILGIGNQALDFEQREFEISELIGKYDEDVVLSGGISRWYSGKKELMRAYNECVWATSFRLARGFNKIFHFPVETDVYDSFDYTDTLKRLLLDHNVSAAKEVVNSLLKRLVEDNITLSEFYCCVVGLFSVFMQIYSERIDKYQDNTNEIFDVIKQNIYETRTIDQFRENLYKILELLCSDKAGIEDNSIAPRMVKYIKSNYADDISLSQLARTIFFADPSHLSRLFKQSVGTNFSKYVIQIRMNKAIDLLKGTDLKVSEISGLVGYNDNSYFIATFKGHYNVTPERYRSNYKTMNQGD